MNTKTIVLVAAVVAVVGAIALSFTFVEDRENGAVRSIVSFEECVAADNPVMESYPRQCRANGELFVEYVGNELEKADLIRLSTPRPNEIITSPLEIRGVARGHWFFEASFPVRLYDEDGSELAVGIATAEDEWMTEEFVPFSVTIEFDAPATRKGTLVLEKDNPSGLPEYENKLIVPARFKN